MLHLFRLRRKEVIVIWPENWTASNTKVKLIKPLVVMNVRVFMLKIYTNGGCFILQTPTALAR